MRILAQNCILKQCFKSTTKPQFFHSLGNFGNTLQYGCTKYALIHA